MKTSKSRGKFLWSFGKIFSLFLSLFLLAALTGCGGGSDSEEASGWDIYSAYVTISGTEYFFKLTVYYDASGDSYEIERDNVVVSDGTVEIKASTGEMEFTLADGTKTFNASFAPTSVGFMSVEFSAGQMLDNSGNPLSGSRITLFQSQGGLVLSDGYKAATAGKAAYLYYSLPKQYAYALTSSYPGHTAAIPIMFAGRTSITLALQAGTPTQMYSIDQWVTQAKVNAHTPKGSAALSGDARDLYSYIVLAESDGFTWRSDTAQRPDLSWTDEFAKAYVTTMLDGARIRFDVQPFTLIVNGINGNGAGNSNYRNVSGAAHIFAMRTINVQLGSTLNNTHSNLVRVQTGATSGHNYTCTNTRLITETTVMLSGSSITAIKVDENFLTNYITANSGDISSRTFTIEGLTGSQNYSYEDMQSAYFIPSREIIAVVSGGVASKTVNYPVTIKINGAVFEPPVIDATNQAPAQAAAY